MGNKKKNESWLPSDPLRVEGFSRMLASELYGHNREEIPRVCDIFKKINKQTGISENGIRKWVNGDAFPNETNTKLIKEIAPKSVEILTPNLNSTAISRFLCALDIWGSRLDSPARGRDKFTSFFSAGACLEQIAKHWAPYELVIDNSIHGIIIPKIKHYVPDHVNLLKYRANDYFSILEFMFECGGFIDFDDADFEDWAVDLASATLSIKASIDCMSSSKQSLSGEIRDLSNFLFNLLFNNDIFKHEKFLSKHLARKYPDITKSISTDYAERLISARSILKNKLLTFGSDLSIANELAKKIPDMDLAFQKIELENRPYNPELLKHLTEDNSLLKRKVKTNFIYTFKVVRKRRIVTFKEEESDTETILPLRNDLFCDYPKSPYLWGYEGSGPRLLATSIIAHHLGHDEFGYKKAIYLVENHLSKFLEPHHLRTFLLTTDLLNRCVSSR